VFCWKLESSSRLGLRLDIESVVIGSECFVDLRAWDGIGFIRERKDLYGLLQICTMGEQVEDKGILFVREDSTKLSNKESGTGNN
jgi:hypothetical protein